MIDFNRVFLYLVKNGSIFILFLRTNTTIKLCYQQNMAIFAL